MSRTHVLGAIFLMLSLSLLWCGNWQTFYDPASGYSVRYPEDWQIKTDSLTGFFEASCLSAKAALPSVFSIEVHDWQGSKSDPGMVNAPVLDISASSGEHADDLTDIRVVSTKDDTLHGFPAQEIEYLGSRYGELVEHNLQVRVQYKDRVYLLKCVGEDGYYFDLVSQDFRAMLDSFRIQPDVPDYLRDYIKVRADLDGSDTVIYWKGKAFGYVPGEKRKELFALEGYHIVRAEPKEDGYYLLAKEFALITDLRTNKILDTWRNPYTGKDVQVVQICNDPVNFDYGFEEKNLPLLPLILPSMDLEENIAYYSEIFPFYDNPLPRKEFPQNSQSSVYQAAEFTQYLAAKDTLANLTATSVPMVYTLTRVSPWLPFMGMSNRQGSVLMYCHGRKLPGGFADLPEQIKTYVLQQKPDFASAPVKFSKPNETIWTYFKKLSVQITPEAN